MRGSKRRGGDYKGRYPGGSNYRNDDNRSGSRSDRRRHGSHRDRNHYNSFNSREDDEFRRYPDLAIPPRFLDEYPVDPLLMDQPLQPYPVFRSNSSGNNGVQMCGIKDCHFEGNEFMIKEHIKVMHSQFYDNGNRLTGGVMTQEESDKWHMNSRFKFTATPNGDIKPNIDARSEASHHSANSLNCSREKEQPDATQPLQSVQPPVMSMNEEIKRVIDAAVEEPIPSPKNKKIVTDSKKAVVGKNKKKKLKRKAEEEDPVSSDASPIKKKNKKKVATEEVPYKETERISLDMVFVDETEITNEKETILKQHLSKKLDDAIEAGLSPIFEGINLVDGHLHITSANEETLKWLIKVVKKIPQLWDGAKIKLLPKDDIKLTKLSVFIPGTVEDAAVVFKRISGQNKTINTKRWKIYSQIEDKNKGQIFEILIDKPTVKQLEAVDFRLYYQLGQLVFRISKNQPQKGDEKHLKVRTDIFG